MQKFFSFFVLVSFLAACSNDGTSQKAADSTSTSPNLTNVQNVNGNQPDTTTGIQLDTRSSGDSSKKTDTMQH